MPDEGLFVTTAADPAGPWCAPWCLQEAKGWIDPCPFWDDDGRAWLLHAYAHSRSGLKDRIHLRPMSPDGRRLLGEGVEILHTPHHPYLEGLKLHKLGDRYLLLAPGGGVQNGWQAAFRSTALHGPYEERIVLETGSTPVNGPHQGALVDTPSGEWWFLHFQDCGAFGRIVHLQPVAWEDGWPKIGVDHDGNGVGEPVAGFSKPRSAHAMLPHAPATTDAFDAPTPGLQWQWQANHQPDWATTTARPGWLRLHGQEAAGLEVAEWPHFFGQKFPARTFTAETLLDFSGAGAGGLAGLAVVGGGASAWAGLEAEGGGFGFRLAAQGGIRRADHWSSARIRLRVEVFSHGLCRFLRAAGDGPWQPLLETFTAREGGWMGARVGLFCTHRPAAGLPGFADFGPFRLG